MSDPDVHAGRDVRQRDLVPPVRLAAVQAIVIGCGSVGRQVALQLAALGVPAMTLYDHDVVSVENLAVQGFGPDDLDSFKVHAVANVAHPQNPLMELNSVAERFRKSHVRGWPRDRDVVVFACVDSIETRRVIWDAVRDRCGFFADGRMAAETLRVLASASPHSKAYDRTLFAAGEAYVGRCTSKSTIYSASVCAGLMLSQFTRWLRGLPVIADVQLNLFAMELSVTDD
jgi:sulfur carrier protein ThiS adenylyltransferase